MCDRGFNTNYLLKKHMQKSHGVELLSKMPKSDQVIIAQQQVEDVSSFTICLSVCLSAM